MIKVNQSLFDLHKRLNKEEKKRYTQIVRKVKGILDLQAQAREKILDLCFALGIPEPHSPFFRDLVKVLEEEEKENKDA
jgi:hypothetical protein